MKKYEYKVYRCKKLLKTESCAEEELNRLGAEGWEAVSVTDYGETYSLVIVLKREID